MRVGIGILAHNEGWQFERTLRSLFEQVGVGEAHGSIDSLHVVIVVNGSTGPTLQVARETIERLARGAADHRVLVRGALPGAPEQLCDDAEGRDHPVDARVGWEIQSLTRPGKSNAWNYFVHRFVDPACEALVLLDADIVFGHARVLVDVLQALTERPGVDVVTDVPIKTSTFESRPGFQERLSLAASDLAREEARTAICGQFYCGRGAVLRNVLMPTDLSVEDGFLRAMIVTDMFTKPEDPGRVFQREDAYHLFESPRGLRARLRHEVRLLIGSALNTVLFDDLWRHSGAHGGADRLLRQRFASDPHWYEEMVDRSIASIGAGLVPWSLALARARGWRSLPRSDRIRGAAVLLVTIGFSLLAVWKARRILRRGGGLAYW